MVLIVFNVFFWTLFEQAGSSLTLFADRNTDRSVFGLFSMSAPQTQNFNPISIVLFAPVMSILWTALAKRGLEPSIPVKFAIALVGVGARLPVPRVRIAASPGRRQFQVGLVVAGRTLSHPLARRTVHFAGRASA